MQSVVLSCLIVSEIHKGRTIFISTLKMRKLRFVIIAIAIVIVTISTLISRSRIRVSIVYLPCTVVRGRNRVLRCGKAHQDNPNELAGWLGHQGMPLANKRQMEVMEVVWFSKRGLQASTISIICKPVRKADLLALPWPTGSTESGSLGLGPESDRPSRRFLTMGFGKKKVDLAVSKGSKSKAKCSI